MDSSSTGTHVVGSTCVLRDTFRDSTRHSRRGPAPKRDRFAGSLACAIAVLSVVVCATVRAYEDAGTLKKIDAELKAMDTDLAAIRSIRDSYRAAAPKGNPPVTITLTFPHVVEWRNNIGEKKRALR